MTVSSAHWSIPAVAARRGRLASAVSIAGAMVAGGMVAGLVLVGCSGGSSSNAVGSASTSPLPGRGPGTYATASPSVRRPSVTRPATTGTSPSTARPSATGPVRVVHRKCPYLSNAAEEIAEGKKVGRSVVLAPAGGGKVGCRFYLAYPDYHAVAQITVATYPSEIVAFNTVAYTGGSSAESTPGVGDGAVLYRTPFYRPDGRRDWACIFAVGKTVVTVKTDATMSSVDARNVAVAIVAKF